MASFAERMTGAMKADVNTFEEIEADQTAPPQAVAVIVIAGIASLIGNSWRFGICSGIHDRCSSVCAVMRSGLTRRTDWHESHA